jgi:hypothetical protein
VTYRSLGADKHHRTSTAHNANVVLWTFFCVGGQRMQFVAASARSLQADMQAELRDMERAVTSGTRDAGRFPGPMACSRSPVSTIRLLRSC